MRINNAKFTVFERLDMASTGQEGTVTINRTAGLFSVRPKRRRRVYELSLSTVARMVCRAVIYAEAEIARRERKARK